MINWTKSETNVSDQYGLKWDNCVWLVGQTMRQMCVINLNKSKTNEWGSLGEKWGKECDQV